MSIRAWLPLGSRRSALGVARVGVFAVLLPLAACAGAAGPTTETNGRLFARGLDEITDLYIEPVSTRQLALAGTARLARLDDKLAVAEGGDAGGKSLGLTYGGRDVAVFAMPADADTREWGEVLAGLIAAAKGASPHVAAMPREGVEKAVFDGITGTLDRFSRYSPPEAARDQRAARDGFGGIGISLDTTDDAFRIVAVTPQGPAARAGLKPEDKIIAIDGVSIVGRVPAEVIHLLRGPVASTVAVRVARPGSAQPRDFNVERALVIVPTVTMSRDGGIAVFHIVSFNQSTTQRLTEGLAEARRQTGGQLAGVVLDLRGNPGGLLDQAVSLADLFIHTGPIVSTVGRHPAAQQYFAASGRSVAAQIPVVVLINGGSASSSEIVAAALQDAGRAVVIGSSSYGKGTVQTVLRLPNDGELTLTWARLVTPAGYYLQTHGVVPTLCTSDLGDDEGSLQRGLERASASAPATPLALQPRAGLDERAWSELRRSCPARQTSPAVDLKMAERVLADPRLYAAALHPPHGATALARNAPPVAQPERALTDVDGALSSRQR